MNIAHVHKAQAAIVDAMNALWEADDDEDTDADRALVPLVRAVEEAWTAIHTYLERATEDKEPR